MPQTFPLPAQTSQILQLTHHQEMMEGCAAVRHSLVAMGRCFDMSDEAVMVKENREEAAVYWDFRAWVVLQILQNHVEGLVWAA
jgi:hypothetical protein